MTKYILEQKIEDLNPKTIDDIDNYVELFHIITSNHYADNWGLMAQVYFCRTEMGISKNFSFDEFIELYIDEEVREKYIKFMSDLIEERISAFNASNKFDEVKYVSYLNGEIILHRIDGPALINYKDDFKEWYIYNVQYTEAEFNKEIREIN